MVAALMSATALSPAPGWAQEGQIRVQGDLEYIYSDFDSENRQTGDKTESEFSYFKQKYDVQLQTQLFPYLSVRGGGLFQLTDQNVTTKRPDPGTGIIDRTRSGFDQTLTRYFGEVNLSNPLFAAATAYRRITFDQDLVGLPATTLNREEISGVWHWSPVDLPTVGLDFNRFRSWDDAGTREQETGLLVLKTRYDRGNFSTNYTYTRNDVIEKVRRAGALTQLHDGGLRYVNSYFGDRLGVTGGARYNYSTVEPSGGAEVEQPTTSPGSQFYLLDDSDPSTLTVVDAANPLTNVNIGRDGPMNDVAVGLNFGPPTEVDRIHVVPREDQNDPELATPTEIAIIASSFVWRAFTSDDQISWTEQPVTSATYDAFDNRFEISFAPDADTPYVKLVTTPLSNATKRIELSTLRAFTTIPGAPGLKVDNFNQTYNVGVRWNATPDTTVSYQSFMQFRESNRFNQDSTMLTNGLNVRHDFMPWLYGDARVQRTDTMGTQRPDSASHSYSTSLHADFLPTLDQRLIYSGRHDQLAGDTGYENSIFLRTNADIYRDWSVVLDLGYSARSALRGEDGTSTTLRLSTNIAPNPKTSFTIDYTGSYETQARLAGFDHKARFQVFWVPIRTLSLFAQVSLRDNVREAGGVKVAQDYSANWVPFPDGQVTFNLAFNQTIDTEGNEVRALTPRIELRVMRNLVLTMSFDYGTIETRTEKRDVRTLRTNLRAFF
jgi:hypothetical protein